MYYFSVKRLGLTLAKKIEKQSKMDLKQKKEKFDLTEQIVPILCDSHGCTIDTFNLTNAEGWKQICIDKKLEAVFLSLPGAGKSRKIIYNPPTIR